MKSLTISVIRFFVKVLQFGPFGLIVQEQIITAAMEKAVKVEYKSDEFKFAIPNKLCRWRVDTFSTKEPETLEWIDSFEKGSVFWDIGANIGLYSVYAAKKKTCDVYAFEPSVFNLELLARNIFINNLTERVSIIPVPLSSEKKANTLRMTTKEWGGALSTFGEFYGYNGNALNSIFEYRVFGITMDDVIKIFNLPQPDFIKIDVDGIEHLVLQGGPLVLQHIKGLLIEVNDNFIKQAEECQRILNDSGLVLKEKRHSEMIDKSSLDFQNAYNQIWIRGV